MGRSVSAKIAVKNQLEISEFLKSIPWRTTMERLKKRRPMIFVFFKGSKVNEFFVMEESGMLRQGKTQDERQEELKEAVVTELASDHAQEAVEVVKAKLEPNGTEADTLPPVQEPAAAETTSNEGEVSVGRWVRFESEDKSIKQGCVQWISQDETDFLVTLRDGGSLVVKASQLLSLIPAA